MSLNNEQLLEIYYWMKLTRAIDDRLLLLYNQGKILGAAFSQRGHEAIAVGSAYALEKDDVIAGIWGRFCCVGCLRVGSLPNFWEE